MRLKSYRRTSQLVFTLITAGGLLGIGTMGFVYPYFFCYACPFDIAACPIGMLEHGAADIQLFGLAAGLTVIGYSLGFLLLMAALFGRGFCGWGCPVGLVQDVTRKTGVHKSAKKAVAPNGMNRSLRWFKYGFLITIPILAWYFLDLVYTRFCPVGGVTGTLPTLIFYPGDWAPSTWFAIKVISIISFFALVVFVGRGWCKYLCPVGAALAPGNLVAPLRLVRDEENCTDCGLCERNCPMNCDDIGRKSDPECILCGRCTESCNHKSLKLKYAPGGRATHVTAAFVVLLVVSSGLFAYGYTGVGYERTNDVNDFPCLGCLALDPAGSSEFAPF
ncbi:4Fe-4S binding protein, partial [Candidatus Uhrbacteria bacterium]|nr:4Fe-4S binding protein [Candidatus Uhrbacteria bacterium]